MGQVSGSTKRGDRDVNITTDELVRRFRAALSEGDTDFFTDQNAYDWINEAQDVIFTDAPFTYESVWELDNTALPVGANTFLVPDACAIPTAASMRDTSGNLYRLNYMEPDRMDRITVGTTSMGSVPRYCTYRRVEDGTAIEIWPRPSAQVPLYVQGLCEPKRVEDMESISDLPRPYVQAIIFYAVWCAKGKDEEDQQAREAERKFAAEMNKLAERKMDVQRDQNNTVLYGRQTTRIYGGGWRYGG